MAAAVGFLVRNREPRVYLKRTELDGMRERDIIERYRLSSERIQWLIRKFNDQLERDTERNCPLSPETQVSGLNINNNTDLKPAFIEIKSWFI